MELTIEEALQQGIAAQKEGKLQDAERFYRAILQSQPLHPDANHNLGILALSINKADAALPLLKTALKANPKIEQFWLSYIGVLIKEKQFEMAKTVLEQGKNQGMAGKKVDALGEHLILIAQAQKSTLPEQKKSLKLSEKRKKLAKQKKNKKAKKKNSKAINPSEIEVKLLLEHYDNERYCDAEKLALSITKQFPKDPFAWTVLSASLKNTGRLSESLAVCQKTTQIAPQNAEAHNNLGITLQELGRLDEAEASLRQAIVLKFDFSDAHNNLGNTLKKLDRLEGAEASYNQAIKLRSDNELAYNNLGVTLQELGRFNEAEARHKQAVSLKPDFAEAHNNLGITLQELGRLDEAEASYRQAIALKPDYAETYANLGVLFCVNGNKDLALESLQKATEFDPEFGEATLLLAVLKSRKSKEKSAVRVGGLGNPVSLARLKSNPLILHRAVEAELITTLYTMESVELDKFDNSRISDVRYGDGKCSPNFSLFENDSSIIKSVAEDLIVIMRKVVKSDVYIDDSFFNILEAGGGTTPHRHLNELDKNKVLNIGKQKYSLVYYLSVGDQNCSDPGILKLYDPNEDILPCEGMIVIIPAAREHSAVYGGAKDRVMIGVNFYAL